MHGIEERKNNNTTKKKKTRTRGRSEMDCENGLAWRRTDGMTEPKIL